MNDPHNDDSQMKQFIVLTEELLSHYASATKPVISEPIIEEESTEIEEHFIIQECRDIVFKLRAFMEDAAGGDYALGIEIGMQRAADMIENMIRRNTKKDDDFE